jgi:CMP-N-acetylneuraminic acid synthetase
MDSVTSEDLAMSAEILCVVGARGGSKGVPGKNLRPLNGVPLVERTLRQAKRLFATVVLTTDDQRIADVGLKVGVAVPFLRPAELASDTAPKVPAIAHAVREMESIEGRRFDVVIDLDATCPLRDDADVLEAVEFFTRSPDADNVISVTPARKNPYFNQVRIDAGRMSLAVAQSTTPLRRQDAPRIYDINGAVYVWRRTALEEGDLVVRSHSYAYVMPPERSIDIDTELDFRIVEFLLADGERA